MVDAVDSKSTSSNRVLVQVQSSAMWIDDFDLFLFDFDGLLVSSEELHFHAYREMCARRGFALSWDLHQFFEAAHANATGIRERLQALFPPLRDTEWGLLYQEKKQIYEKMLERGGLTLLPGVETLLLELARLSKKRCVVTNSARVQIEAIRGQLPALQTIPRWFTREDYARPKPAPDGYLLALQELKEEGDRVIGFEDSARGYEALKSAGVENRVLVCSFDHPQLERMEGALHVPSMDALSYDTFIRNRA